MADETVSSREDDSAHSPKRATEAAGATGAPGHAGLRASHEDRDRVVDLLQVAAGDGRLTVEELDERVELALSARTYAELVPLTADLPPSGLPAVPGAAATVPRAEPKDLMRIQCGSGHARRDGQWVVPRRLEVKVTSGHIVLDFTRAVIAAPVLELDADIRSGHLRIITRPGIQVDAGEVAVRSGHIVVRSPWSDSVPVQLRIDITGNVHSGHVSARPPRRSLWQWLRRSPRPYAEAIAA
jgi:hypothetical protein